MSETRTVDVLDVKGAKAGTADLPAELFDVPANIPLMHQVVTAQLAAARQGTHSTKSRGEVRGGGAKPYRQKGTGRARQGSKRAPQFVGGGTVHGPQPRSYAQRTPKKMITAALRGALSDRARDGRVHVVSELVSGDVPSTKAALAALAAVTTSDKLLVVIHRDEDLAWLSLRNVATVHVIVVDQLNAYDVLVNDDVVFTSAALHAYVDRGSVTAPPEPVEDHDDALRQAQGASEEAQRALEEAQGALEEAQGALGEAQGALEEAHGAAEEDEK
ncbi:MAG TPA: 50S ribosomal protein L4 [Propionibacteriaceae bacterium]|jgi:large subunit ribosomal protein L4|nr:50S ribosomal protein L4 [Propionibacteriaceae bacterium]HMI33003.1 50S ribosomal protein L4 [Propionibacteriaceae bacterium]